MLPRLPYSTLFPYTTLFRSPFLPVVRRTRGGEELGVVFDARSARLVGFRATVFLTNVFLLPPHFEAFLALRSEEHTSELQSQSNLVCRLLLEKKKKLKIVVN